MAKIRVFWRVSIRRKLLGTWGVPKFEISFFIMLFIAQKTHKNYKKNNFEIFWYPPGGRHLEKLKISTNYRGTWVGQNPEIFFAKCSSHYSLRIVYGQKNFKNF